MQQEHSRFWVSDVTGNTFAFAERFEVSGDIPTERLTSRINSGDTPGEDGEYQEGYSTFEPRVVTLKGRIIAADLLGLQTALDDLVRAFPKGAAGKLYRNIIDLDDNNKTLSARFLRCRVSYFEKGLANGLPTNEWEIGFRSGEPLYREDTHFEGGAPVVVPRSVALATANGGVTNVTPGGGGPVRPVLTLVVTSPGTITLQAGGVGASRRPFVLTVTTNGTYTVDGETRPSDVTFGGVSVLSQMRGDFLTLGPDASTITLTLTDGATLGAGSQIAWRRTYPFTV